MTFCLPRRVPVSANDMRVLSLRTTSHQQVMRADTEPAEGERSGKRKILIVTPTPSGSSV